MRYIPIFDRIVKKILRKWRKTNQSQKSRIFKGKLKSNSPIKSKKCFVNLVPVLLVVENAEKTRAIF